MEFSIRSLNSFCRDFRVKSGLAWIVFIQACNDGCDHSIAHQCDFVLFFLFHRYLASFFLKDNEKGSACRVRLCWRDKKFIGGCFNLHELSGKASGDQNADIGKEERYGEKPLPPMEPVTADDGFQVVFIHTALPV